GVKYIPITKASMPNHIHSARNALLMYIHETRQAGFTNGKMIFLQGSPQTFDVHGIKVGRLSGLVYHHVPGYLLKNRLPSFATNCIEDWEQKVEAICHETIGQDMSLISGIPPWVIMYFEKLLEITGKQAVKEVFPNFNLFVYGGVNYAPYRSRMEELIGSSVPSIETYPASEGFIAFQDSQTEPGLLLNVDSGIFFEFIPVDEIGNANPARYTLRDVELNKQYALIINSNAGLWGYNIGDTIKFVSLNPHRIVVTGRVKHFISAFGEHVIGEEVEFALMTAANKFGAIVKEFTVAPQVNPASGLPYHEWFVEFEVRPANIEIFADEVDQNLQQKNIYYRDLIQGKILRPLQLTLMQPNAFKEFMKRKGKLGGQNKVPRLSNDRIIADELNTWKARS
ncbi:MAG: GH3 auxin-responsive promoter family protein, partial [Chitinophagales bacterium]